MEREETFTTDYWLVPQREHTTFRTVLRSLPETSAVALQRAFLQLVLGIRGGGGWKRERSGGRMLTIGFNNGCDGVRRVPARLQLPPTALDHNSLFLLQR